MSAIKNKLMQYLQSERYDHDDLTDLYDVLVKKGKIPAPLRSLFDEEDLESEDLIEDLCFALRE